MKSIIKGMTLLLAGASFVACSKDVAFDENAQKEAKAQAEIAQKFAAYQADFVKTFGSIAPGHQWGFDQTGVVTTRGAVTDDSNNEWFIPEAFRTPNQNKEGVDANTVDNAAKKTAAQGGLLDDIEGFNFNNYWLQHVEQPSHKNGYGKLQAWDSNAKNGQGDWVDVDHFAEGKNNSFFECLGINSYINQGALHCTTLMTNMGAAKDNNGKRFRFGSEGNWSYDYKFLYYENSYFLCLKRIWVNGGGNKQETCWWIIRIAEAEVRTNNTKYQARVLCEDMGEIGDYDFNDLAFDAIIDKDNNIDITIVAAGGTLPIYIGGKDEEHGGTLVKLGKMTNTGENNGVAPQTIHYAANADGSAKFASIREIPIWVNPGGEALPYELEAKPSEAPQKICTYLYTVYPDEYVRIDKAYNNFTSWVNNEDPQKWSKNVKWWLVDLNLKNNSDQEPAEEE